MKKILYKLSVIALGLGLMLSLGSCGGEENNVDPQQLADDIIAEICEKHEMNNGFVFTSSSTEPGEYLDDDLIASYYGDAAESPDFSKIDNYCVYIDESDYTMLIDVGVFKMNDTSYSDTLIAYLKGRIDDKIAKAANYPDTNVAELSKAVVKKTGSWVYYAVCYDSTVIGEEIAEALK